MTFDKELAILYGFFNLRISKKKKDSKNVKKTHKKKAQSFYDRK